MCHLTDGLLLVILGLATCLGRGRDELTEDGLRKASACYSNYNSFMRLHCGPEEEIEVQKVVYGVKVIGSDCVSPATKETYKKRCCSPEPEDCVFDAPLISAGFMCNGYNNCEMRAQWDLTAKDCDQEEYKQFTNYMQTTYKCKPSTSEFVGRSRSRSSRGSTSSTTRAMPAKTIRPASTSRIVTSTTPEMSTFINISSSAHPVTKTEVGHKKIGIPNYSLYKEDGDNNMSTSMIGAIIGGSLGMLLTFVVFIFYWGRKRRLRIISRPEPSVWDYLLSQTFTVRGSRGYDHFSSTRSSVSSDASISPVIRKNLWLPNISPEDDFRSDVTSNLDNDTTRVEVHQSASPHPYAFVSLSVPQSNLARPTHEA